MYPWPEPGSIYPWIKLLHQGCVALSLSLFAVRWLGVLAGGAWPLQRGVRWVSVAVDTLLLCAGTGLWALGGWHPGHDPWLGTKLALLVVYVLLGSLALKRARTRLGKCVFGILALAVAAQMVATALHHYPAGLWAGGM